MVTFLLLTLKIDFKQIEGKEVKLTHEQSFKAYSSVILDVYILF